jgi:20S proteasome subunit beta 7
LTRLLYNRRSKFDPLWNSLVIAGFEDGKSFLGTTNLLGTHYEDDTIATGFGSYLARPLLRKHYENKNGKISEDEAKKILEESMRVLWYRDGRAINKMQIAIINKDGVKISDPYSLKTEWKFKGFN